MIEIMREEVKKKKKRGISFIRENWLIERGKRREF